MKLISLIKNITMSAVAATICSCNPTQRPEVVTGLEAMAKIERLPLLYPNGTKKNRFISYDASGGNGFGFYKSTFTRYVDERGELVIFDAFGPGCLFRQQMNIWINHGIGKKSETLRIKYYFDSDSVPRINLPVKEFFRGDHKPVTEPFTMIDKNMNFGICYYPFPFSERLKVTLSDTLITRLFAINHDEGCNWYQYDYLTYPYGVKVKSWTDKVNEYEDVVREQWENVGADPKPAVGNVYSERSLTLQPEQEQTLFEQSGEGSVSSIELQISPFDSLSFYNTFIRIFWDSLTQAAVDMPLSYFFGGGGPKDGQLHNSMRNLLFGFDSLRCYCFFPMPFWQKAHITLLNTGDKNVEVRSKVGFKPSSVYGYPKDGAAYFMAKVTKDSTDGGVWSRKFNKPYMTAFEETGHGHVVAVNMWSGNFLEDGDEFTYIDNPRMPWIHGDGTEDDFNQGWAGFTYSKPLWGALKSGVKGSYRIHLNEPYIFYDMIDMRFEQNGGKYGDIPMFARRRAGTNDTICETEFFVAYYKTTGGLILTDSIDIGNLNVNYKVEGETWRGSLTQSYDSYDTQDDWCVTADDGVAFNKYVEFKANINPSNNGVRLVVRINRKDNGLQKGKVYIDGKRLPLPWHIVTYSSIERQKRSFDGWFDAEYEIPAKYVRGKEQITVRIEHEQSLRGELNAFFVRIYSYSPKP